MKKLHDEPQKNCWELNTDCLLLDGLDLRQVLLANLSKGIRIKMDECHFVSFAEMTAWTGMMEIALTSEKTVY
jgi:hypothetical protein